MTTTRRKKKRRRKILNSQALVQWFIYNVHANVRRVHWVSEILKKKSFSFQLFTIFLLKFITVSNWFFFSCRHYVHCYVCKVCDRFVVRIWSNDTIAVWKVSCYGAECISSATNNFASDNGMAALIHCIISLFVFEFRARAYTPYWSTQ